jgi:glucose-6-phosphate isomerase
VFGFWGLVGKRYSIWSSIGLVLALGIGKEQFAEFVQGG